MTAATNRKEFEDDAAEIEPIEALMLDRTAAAAKLGVSAAAFREMAADPSCPLGDGVKRGRKIVWSEDAIEAAQHWTAARKMRARPTLKAVPTSLTAAPVNDDATNASAPSKPIEPVSLKAVETPPRPQAVSGAPVIDAVKKAAERIVEHEQIAANTRHSAKAVGGAAPSRQRFSPIAPMIDPIGAWLEMCRGAAQFFHQTADPRRALLLMNPFAPAAAYASFAQPGLLPQLLTKPNAALGVWGAFPAATSGAEEMTDPARLAAKAQSETERLYKCSARLAR